MTNTMPHTILFVDDEIPILKALQRLFRKSKYQILVANSGQEGIKQLKNCSSPISLIVSDQKMPEMSGSQFLEQAKKISPDSFRFLLTGYSDMDAVADAINKGEIHRYFTKPWNDNDLKLQVQQVLKEYDLILENKRLTALTQQQNHQLFKISKILNEKVKNATKILNHKNKELEANLFNMINLFGSLVEIHIPHLKGHGERVSKYAKEIADVMQLSAKEIRNIEIAGLLHDIGKINFTEKLIKNETHKWSGQEKNIYLTHPETGSTMIQFIEQLEDVANLILCHHENLDGSGFPNKLNEDKIPLGSKIIAVADGYDKIFNLKIDADKYVQSYLKKDGYTKDALNDGQLRQQGAILYLKQHAFTWYDPDVVKAFLESLKKQGVYSKNERIVKLEELKEGMILTRHLYTINKRFLLPFNTFLTESYIDKLKAIHMNDPIENIFCQSKKV